MSINLKMACGIAVVAVILVAVIWWFRSRDPLEVAGRRIISCIEDRDAECLHDYMSSLESTNVLANKGSLQRLLDEYVGPTMDNLEAAGEVTYMANPEHEQGIAARVYRRRDGESATLGFDLFQGDDGPVAPHLVTQLIMFAQEAKYFQAVSGERRDVALSRAWRDGAKADAHTLQNIGVVKMLRQFREGAMDWDEYIAMQESRVKKIEQYVKDSKAEAEKKEAEQTQSSGGVADVVQPPGTSTVSPPGD